MHHQSRMTAAEKMSDFQFNRVLHSFQIFAILLPHIDLFPGSTYFQIDSALGYKCCNVDSSHIITLAIRNGPDWTIGQ